jgi:hypothetical protein
MYNKIYERGESGIIVRKAKKINSKYIMYTQIYIYILQNVKYDGINTAPC